jgi:hypothetical protein
VDAAPKNPLDLKNYLARGAVGLVMPQNALDAVMVGALGPGGVPARVALGALAGTVWPSDAEATFLTHRQIANIARAAHAPGANTRLLSREVEHAKDQFSTAVRRVNENPELSAMMRHPNHADGQYNPSGWASPETGALPNRENFIFGRDIFEDTRWLPTPNGWLYGLDPRRNRVNSHAIMAFQQANKPFGRALETHLHDPLLFAAEPKLRDVMVLQTRSPGDTLGSYIPGSGRGPNTIWLNASTPTMDERTRTMYHELQHALQHASGRPNGTSTNAVLSHGNNARYESEFTSPFAMYRAVPGEWEARAAAEAWPSTNGSMLNSAITDQEWARRVYREPVDWRLEGMKL